MGNFRPQNYQNYEASDKHLSAKLICIYIFLYKKYISSLRYITINKKENCTRKKGNHKKRTHTPKKKKKKN